VESFETWERVLQFPGKVISLPLSGLTRIGEAGIRYADDSGLIPRLLNLAAAPEKVGLFFGPASLGDHTGLGGEVRYAPEFFGVQTLAEISGSLGSYNRERLGLLFGPVRVNYMSEWRSRDKYFGVGLDSERSGESAYGQSFQSLFLALFYPFQGMDRKTLRIVEGVVVNPSLTPLESPARMQFGVYAGPRVSSITTGRDPKVPSFETVHPVDAAGSLHQRAEHFVYGARVAVDRRRGLPHWTTGSMIQVDAQRFDHPIEDLALKDSETPARQFTRWTFDAETGFSFWRDPRSIRLAARVRDQALDDGTGNFLISDFSTLGGGAGLSGFEPSRFKDMDSVVGILSYIFPLGKNLEFDLHAETGGVYPELRKAQLDTFETSYGALLRVRTDLGVIGHLGVGWSHEDVRFIFTLGGE
jgi:hypothetical protein